MTRRIYQENPQNPFLKMNPSEFSQKPFLLEIGAGVGMHALRLAKEHPEETIVAIEKTKEKFEKFERRFQSHQRPKNLTPVHAKAQDWIDAFVHRPCLDHIYILYPNPYPRLSQQNKRWHRMPFMKKLVDLMCHKAKMTLATDQMSYFDEAVNDMTKVWGLRMIHQGVVKRPPNQCRTHFERKYRLSSRTCFEAIFMKT